MEDWKSNVRVSLTGNEEVYNEEVAIKLCGGILINLLKYSSVLKYKIPSFSHSKV